MTIPNGNDDTSDIENDNAEVVDQDQDDQDHSEGADDEVEATPENLKKFKDLANNYKIRAEKAEGKLKDKNPDGESKKPQPQKKSSNETDKLSFKDSVAIIKADVPEEDIDRVISFAKLENISVSEALKNDDLKLLLERRAEKRATANATQVGQRRSGNQRVSEQKLLENLAKGEVPENDDDIDRLARARVAARKKGK